MLELERTPEEGINHGVLRMSTVGVREVASKRWERQEKEPFLGVSK